MDRCLGHGKSDRKGHPVPVQDSILGFRVLAFLIWILLLVTFSLFHSFFLHISSKDSQFTTQICLECMEACYNFVDQLNSEGLEPLNDTGFFGPNWTRSGRFLSTPLFSNSALRTVSLISAGGHRWLWDRRPLALAVWDGSSLPQVSDFHRGRPPLSHERRQSPAPTSLSLVRSPSPSVSNPLTFTQNLNRLSLFCFI